MIPIPKLLSILIAAATVATAELSHLQIVNGSTQSVDVFRLSDDGSREREATVDPGAREMLRVPLGREFVVVGRDDGAERTLASHMRHQSFRFDPKGIDGIPTFYTQMLQVHGFPVVASPKVNPYALKEAAFLIDGMLAKRRDLLDAMTRSGARVCIIAHNEFTTDLPEFRHLGDHPQPGFEEFSGSDFWDARARGTGGSLTDPCCSCGEENLLAYPGDPYAAENILIHELAHNIHLRGLVNVDPTFDDRLKATYEEAMKKGLWKGKYASVNHFEYFAEGVQSWFDDNRENDHDHNHVNTRAELLEYDPALAEICREVFGDTEFSYSKPTTRLHGHLSGYDPSAAPEFVWPPRLAAIKQAIRAQAIARPGNENPDDPKATPAENDNER